MYNDVRWEYMQLLEKQEIYRKQRAKQFLLQSADKNTCFFHNYASGRKRRNVLHLIKNEDGEWTTNNEEMQTVIESYFSKLFTANTLDERLSDQQIVKMVSEHESEALLSDITPEEVKETSFFMHPDKAPGPDDLNPSFFQVFWNFVGNDVVSFCQKFMQSGEFPNQVNHAVITLIPKTTIPQNMTEVCPLSLCNVLVRMLYKVMVNR